MSKEFVCCKERANVHDRQAVAVYGDGDSILGHLPRKIFCITFFLEHDGRFPGKVTDRRQHCCESGRMEIPCRLTFSGK